MAVITNLGDVGAGSTIQDLCGNLTKITNNTIAADTQSQGGVNDAWPLFLLPVGFILLIIIAVCEMATSRKFEIIRDLRQTPAHELHRLVEELYHKYNRDHAGDGDGTAFTRYPVATYHDDMVNMKRTVTIVEDLTVYAQWAPELRREIIQSRRRRPEMQRAAREDEVSRLLAFSDRSEPAEHARAMAGRPQESTANSEPEHNHNEIESQDLPPSYPSRAR